MIMRVVLRFFVRDLNELAGLCRNFGCNTMSNFLFSKIINKNISSFQSWLSFTSTFNAFCKLQNIFYTFLHHYFPNHVSRSNCMLSCHSISICSFLLLIRPCLKILILLGHFNKFPMSEKSIPLLYNVYELPDFPCLVRSRTISFLISLQFSIFIIYARPSTSDCQDINKFFILYFISHIQVSPSGNVFILHVIVNSKYLFWAANFYYQQKFVGFKNKCTYLVRPLTISY